MADMPRVRRHFGDARAVCFGTSSSNSLKSNRTLLGRRELSPRDDARAISEYVDIRC
jgi:hypothetical protein